MNWEGGDHCRNPFGSVVFAPGLQLQTETGLVAAGVLWGQESLTNLGTGGDMPQCSGKTLSCCELFLCNSARSNTAIVALRIVHDLAVKVPACI